MFARTDCTNPVFSHLYESIADDLRMRQSLDFGTEAHMQTVWERVKALCTEPMGASVKTSRWWRWEQRARGIIESGPGLHALLMVLIYIGWKRKWWVSFEDSPLRLYSSERLELPDDDGHDLDPGDGDAGGEGDGEAAQDDDAGDGGPAEPCGAAKARQRVQDAKRRLASSMKFAATVLAKPVGVKLFKAMAYLPRPLEEAFSSELEQVKTHRGNRALHQELAAGTYTKTINALVLNFVSPELVALMGITNKPKTKAESDEDMRVGGALWRLILRSLSCAVATNMIYTALPPFSFLRLIDPDPAVVSAALRHAKDSWESLERLEKIALTNSTCAEFVRDLVVPQQIWIREVFVLLAEANFEEVPAFVASDITAFARSPKSTLLNENLNRALRLESRRAGPGKLSATTAWSAASRTDVLRDFDCAPAAITDMAKSSAPTSIPASVFEADASDCSLEDSLLDRIHMSKPDWPAMTPEEYVRQGVRWTAAMQTSGEWETLAKSWWSLLLQPGTLAWREPEGITWLVLHTTPVGAVCVQVAVRRLPASDRFYVHFADVPSLKPVVVAIHGPEDWRCAPCQCIGPGHHELDPQALLRGWTVLPSKASPMLEHACKQGFRGVKVPILRRVFNELNVKYERGKKPVSEAALLAAIIRHVLGLETTDEVMTGCMNKRCEEVSSLA